MQSCQEVVEQYGQIDILIHSAGEGDLRYFEDVTDSFRDGVIGFGMDTG